MDKGICSGLNADQVELLAGENVNKAREDELWVTYFLHTDKAVAKIWQRRCGRLTI